MSDMYEFFSERELQCRCGKCGLGQEDMSPIFMSRLVTLRQNARVWMIVNSAVRCEEYNSQVSNSGRNGVPGPHVPQETPTEKEKKGHAVDIAIYGKDLVRVMFIMGEMRIGITGIGLRQKGPYGIRFLHIDDLHEVPGRPRPWIWTY